MKVGVRLTSSNDAPLPNMSISPEISAPGSGCCKGLIVFEAAIVGVSSFDLTGGTPIVYRGNEQRARPASARLAKKAPTSPTVRAAKANPVFHDIRRSSA